MSELVRVAFDTENPPFSSRDEEGEPSGFSIDLCRVCLDEPDWALQLVPADGPMMQSIWLTTGRVDAILDVTASFRRQRWYDFSAGYYVDEMAVFAPIEGRLWAGLERVDGRLAVKSNSFAEEWLRRHFPRLQLLPVNEALQLEEVVLAGRAVGFSTSVATGHLLNRDHLGGRFRQAGPSFGPAALTLATLTGESTSLLRRFNRGLAEVRSDGRLDRLLRQWSLAHA